MNEGNAEIAARLSESIEVKKRCLEEAVDTIAEIVERIVEAYGHQKKVILCGNGGSAADAQHLAAELVGKFELERNALPAIALTTNTSILTATANDYGFETVFSRQIDALAGEGDVVIGISTSGNSPNILNAMSAARDKGAVTIGMTGAGGSKLEECTDICLRIPSNDTARIQEAHITIGHIICSLVEQTIFGGQRG